MPKCLIITGGDSNPGHNYSVILMYGQNYSSGAGCNPATTASGLSLKISWSNLGVSWYEDSGYNSASRQFNTTGTTYYWFIIG